MTQLEKAFQIEINQLEAKIELMKQLSTTTGFFKMYFLECKDARTNQEAFNKVNELYYNLFNKYRYADYASFKNITNYYHKKAKK